MTKLSLVVLTMLALLFTVDLSLGQRGLIQRYNMNQMNNKELMISNNTVIGADDYMTLFIWKTLNISTLDELYKRNDLKFYSYTFNTSIISSVLNRIIPNEFGYSNSIKTVVDSWSYTKVTLRRHTSCMRGSVLENFDVLIELPQYAARRFRIERNHVKLRKKSDDFLNISDFFIIPLFPTKLYMVSNSELKERTQDVKEELLNLVIANSTLKDLTCSDAIIHDARVMERSHGILNFTTSQLEMFKDISNISKTESNGIIPL